MELKTARLTLLIDPNKKAAFEQLCARQDLTPSQVVRKLIREYLASHGVDYAPSGQLPEPAAPPAAAASGAPAAHSSTRPAARPAARTRRG